MKQTVLILILVLSLAVSADEAPPEKARGCRESPFFKGLAGSVPLRSTPARRGGVRSRTPASASAPRTAFGWGICPNRFCNCLENYLGTVPCRWRDFSDNRHILSLISIKPGGLVPDWKGVCAHTMHCYCDNGWFLWKEWCIR